MSATLVNLVLFQLAWWACVLGAAGGRPWLGPLVALLPLSVFVAGAGRPGRALTGLLRVVAVGFALDSALSWAGATAFPTRTWLLGACPAWMLALWVSFATTLNGCLAWLRSRPVAAALFGLLGGPLAYLAAERIGALRVTDSVEAWVSIGLGWAALLPLAYLLMPPEGSAAVDGRTVEEVADA